MTLDNLSDDDLKALAQRRGLRPKTSSVSSMSNSDLKRLAAERGLLSSPSNNQPKEERSFLQSVGDTAQGFKEGFTQGATFGLIDEAADLTRSGIESIFSDESFSDIFDKNRQQTLDTENTIRERAPVASGVGDVTGSIAGGVAGGATKIGAKIASNLAKGNIAKRSGKAALAGLGVGAVQGFGRGSGGQDERIESAQEGAGLGLVGGAISPAVGIAAGKAFEAGKDLVSSAAEKVGKSLVKKRAAELNLIRELEPDQAIDKVADRIIKDYNGDKDAIKKAMDEALLDEKAIFNIGKEQTIHLADKAALFPTGRQKAAETIFKQTEDAPDKLKAEISSAISNESNFQDALETMVSVGRQKASPLYKEAFGDASNQAINSPNITRILRTPAGNSALREARKNIENSMAVATAGDDIANMQKILKNIDNATNNNQDITLSLEALDQVKRGFDDAIDTAIRSDPSEAKRLVTLKRALVGQMDSADKTGKYIDARRVSGDYLSNKAAMEEGIKFLREDSEKVIKLFKNFGDAEKASYRVGIVKSLRDTIEKSNDGRNVANFFNKEANRKKLRAVLSPKEYRSLKKEAEDVDKLFRVKNRIFSNSSTQERSIGAEEFDSESIQIAKDFALSGSVSNAALNSFGRFVRRKFTGLSDDKAGEVARVLFTRNPSVKEKFVDDILQRAGSSPESLRGLTQSNSDEALQQLKAYFVFADVIKGLRTNINEAGTLTGTVAAAVEGFTPARTRGQFSSDNIDALVSQSPAEVTDEGGLAFSQKKMDKLSKLASNPKRKGILASRIFPSEARKNPNIFKDPATGKQITIEQLSRLLGV